MYGSNKKVIDQDTAALLHGVSCCTMCCYTTCSAGVFLPWVLAYFKDGAGANIKNGEFAECTYASELMLVLIIMMVVYWFLECVRMVWTDVNLEAVLNNPQTARSNSLVLNVVWYVKMLGQLVSTVLGIFICIDYFGNMDGACKAYIQEEGSELFWTCYSITAYLTLILHCLMACGLCCYCMGVATGNDVMTQQVNDKISRV